MNGREIPPFSELKLSLGRATVKRSAENPGIGSSAVKASRSIEVDPALEPRLGLANAVPTAAPLDVNVLSWWLRPPVFWATMMSFAPLTLAMATCRAAVLPAPVKAVN